MYHLRSITRAGLVHKRPDGLYELTPSGRLAVDKMDPETLTAHMQPRVVILLVCWNEAGELLLFKRATHPTIHKVGLPHANQYIGTTLREGAQTAFAAMTGLHAVFKLRGSGTITMYQDDELESYIAFHLLEAHDVQGVLHEKSPNGEFYWSDEKLFAGDDYLPSMPDIMQAIHGNKTPFFIEKSYQL